MSSVHDPERLAALEATRLLDAAREETFDRLTRLASRMLRVPCSVMTLIEDDRQFFLSEDGMRADLAAARETPLSHSFCKHVVDRSAPLVVADAREDALVADNGAVHDYDVIAYCGVPLRLSDGHVIGAFCAIEPDPREWSPGDVELLGDLAALAVEAIELRERDAPEEAEAEPAGTDDDAALAYLPLVHLETREPWGFVARPAATGADVLERACRDLDGHGAGLMVPVTGALLAAPGFVARVAATIAAYDRPPRALILTAHERALLTADDATRRAIGQLRALGVAVALHGAGLGAATLADLAALPIDVVVLADALATPEHARPAAALLAAVQTLGLGAVGGGIADAADATRLAAAGCVTGHGPHFGGPLPADALAAWLATASPRP